TGCAPIDFFIRLRMQHACKLLDGTALSVKEIAAELGYEDPFYFSRTFKSVNHVAPSEYRTMPKELKDKLKPARLPGNISGPLNHQSVTRQSNHCELMAGGTRLNAQILADDFTETEP
ncbi:MAG TPA: helix-turn-helix transcriptional regulator, partial [Verrucomicrobiae bacterium]|nr:helix-turn-helix transcriptional regulator [Verrucomicrobiae bacterium]